MNSLFIAIDGGDLLQVHAETLHIKKEIPFLYSLLRDTLNIDRLTADRSKEIINTRVKSLVHWREAGNETIAAINSGEIDADSIKPHVRNAQKSYEQFYADQSNKFSGKSRPDRAINQDADCDHFRFLPHNVTHAYRWTHMIALVETIMGLTKMLPGGDDIFRWIDIGCGTGNFANKVNPTRFGIKEWDIIGSDFQQGKIEIANRQKARGRRFLVADAFDTISDYKMRQETFQLVSMFEFLEHLDDPLRLIRQLSSFSPKFVLAASPLEEKFCCPEDVSPDEKHLWSFNLKSWMQMFELAGFEIVFSSEVRIGSYTGGIDLLTLLCGPRKELADIGPETKGLFRYM